jgi:signal transduction histidine kinase
MKTSPKKNRELLALCHISKFLGCIDDLQELLQRIMKEAAQTVNAEASSIALYDPQRKDLLFTVSLGKKGSQVRSTRLALGQGIIGYAALHKKPLNIPDAAKDRRFHSGMDEKTRFKSRAILAVPILSKKKLVGALEVINKKGGGSFSPADLRLLEIVAGQAAIAIENAQLYQRMVQMERMSAIGDTASRMVHDLRNPFMVIAGCVELLGDGTLTDEERKKYCKIVRDEIERLNGMTTEVMDFVKGKSDTLFQSHLADDFVQELATYLERDFAPHHICLEVEANYRGKVCMDKHKMQRAIFNISFNARDAMAGGGKFKIQTNLVDSMLEFRLMDTGPGIPAQIRDRIGEPFATSGKAHGTGLGLAIVKKIVTEIHQGTFAVESSPPQPGAFNTAFILRIPLAPPAPAPNR